MIPFGSGIMGVSASTCFLSLNWFHITKYFHDDRCELTPGVHVINVLRITRCV